MELKTHGGEIHVMAGRALLKAEYCMANLGPGTLSLQLEDQATFDCIETTLRLDPWSPDTYEVKEWLAGGALIICGARAVVALNVATLEFGSTVALEYEEAETIDRPWFNEIHERRLLAVATERRVWCLDARVAIRWMWTCRATAQECWICGAPQFVGDQLHVPVRTMRGESIVVLSLDEVF